MERHKYSKDTEKEYQTEKCIGLDVKAVELIKSIIRCMDTEHKKEQLNHGIGGLEMIFLKDNTIYPIGSFYKIELSEKLYDEKTGKEIWKIRGYQSNGDIIIFGTYDNIDDAKKSFRGIINVMLSRIPVYSFRNNEN